MNSPVVGNRCTCDPEQPGAHTAHVPLEIEATYNFEKDLRCQIFGLLAIPHLAIGVAVDQAKVLLVKRLKVLYIRCIHSLILPGQRSICVSPANIRPPRSLRPGNAQEKAWTGQFR